ncbi:MAG: hypothetical protein IJ849_02390 [Selenomonadaceae bacterium]|nr:hypothetical protein [Selenomonadaceae bacterium]
MKRIFTLGLGAILLATLAFGGYCYSATGSPEYALEQAAEAFLQRDEMAFLRFVNEDKLIESAYDEGAMELAQNIAALRARYPDDFFFHHDTSFMLAYTKEHRPAALRLIRGAKQAYFTASRPAATIEENPATWLSGEIEKFCRSAKGECVKLEEREGKAYADIRLTGDDTEYGQMADGLTFRLEVEKVAGDWQIVRVANVDELLFPVTDSAERFWTVQGWQ